MNLRYCSPFPNARGRIKMNRPIRNITLKLVAMAMSLEPLEKGQIRNLRTNTYHRWTFGENRSSRSWDICLKDLLNEGVCTPTTLLNSGVTGPRFTKFTNSVARSPQKNCLKLEWQYFNSFPNARVTNKGELYDFANFDPKIGRHGNVPWAKEIGGKSAIYDQISTTWWRWHNNR